MNSSTSNSQNPSSSPPANSENPSADPLFEEPEDELEEFEETGECVSTADPELVDWDEDWDATGWDDEDPDDEFVTRLMQELEKCVQQNSQNASISQQPS